MTHEIILSKYRAVTAEGKGPLFLGTARSYGKEKLHITLGESWEGLAVTATFTNHESTTVIMDENCEITVPPEATEMPTTAMRPGRIVFRGNKDGEQQISTNLLFVVEDHGPDEGDNSITPTPDQYAQFVNEVAGDANRAEAAAVRAEIAAAEAGNVSVAINRTIDFSKINETKDPGCYAITSDTSNTINGISFRYAYMRVEARDAQFIVQTIYAVSSSLYILKRNSYSGEWQDWECENPPLEVGVEYRTTERWMGKAVYAQLVDLGEASGFGIKQINMLTKVSLVRADVKCGDSIGMELSETDSDAFTYHIYSSSTMVRIEAEAGTNRIGQQMYAALYYTK